MASNSKQKKNNKKYNSTAMKASSKTNSNNHSENNTQRTNRKIRRKKASRQVYTSYLILCIAIVIVAVLVVGYRGLLEKEKAYQENIEELNGELDHLEDTNKQLKSEMNNMDSKEFKEKVAREKLGMIGKDEILITESVDGSTGRGVDETEESSETSEEETDSQDSSEEYDEESYDNSYDEDSYDYE